MAGPTIVIGPKSITVTIMDEGYFSRAFTFSSRINMKKVLDRYRAYVCNECSNVSLLEFWYETTKIEDGHTARSLGMQFGDIIDVRIPQQCTRGACPVPPEQKFPNIHYLLKSQKDDPSEAIQEAEVQPQPPKRISLIMQDTNGREMAFRMKTQSKLDLAMEAFATMGRKQMHECRFLVDGVRVYGHQTPAQLDIELEHGIEDGDTIEMYYEVRNGGNTGLNG